MKFVPRVRADGRLASLDVIEDDGSAGSVPVVGNTDVIDLTFSLDTNAYVSGDVLADTQVLANAFRVVDGKGILQSIALIDEDDQGQALDLLFFSANRSIGTENSAPSISDANARDFLCKVSVSSSDWIDLGGVRVASVSPSELGKVVKAASGTADLYLAAITRGTPTHTASGLRARVGIMRD